ncbi:MAG: metallophosphoesterase [Acidobacteriaceae bacterium]|nr:metallophosphoesterase [Acidobacteriaceae bacterium]
MIPLRGRFLLLVPLLCGASIVARAETWTFAVSGDSRNCGDVVMPAIARGAIDNHAAFYWHLGDFRAIYIIDQDFAAEHKPAYLENAWQDFIDNQIMSFGELPVYLGLGNHEVIPPMTHEKALATFAPWLNAQAIQKQRLSDDPSDAAPHGYYHWLRDHIDFVNLDNSLSSFDEAQMRWVAALLTHDQEDESVRAVVAGMHEALPESVSKSHSMNQTLLGTEGGREVYRRLLELKNHKPVYVLASHSHYYMKGIYETGYWKAHGGVLPGWIVGTAGAERYKLPDPLPEGMQKGKDAIERQYGYLLATVSDSKDDPIHFDFHEVKTSDVPRKVVERFTSGFVQSCWDNNPPYGK